MQLSSCGALSQVSGPIRRRNVAHIRPRKADAEPEVHQPMGSSRLHAAPSKRALDNTTNFIMGFLNPSKRKINKQDEDHDDEDGTSEQEVKPGQPPRGTPRQQPGKTLQQLRDSPRASRGSKRHMLRLEENMALESAESFASSAGTSSGDSRQPSPAPRIRRTPRVQRELDSGDEEVTHVSNPPAQHVDKDVITRDGSVEGTYQPAGSHDLGASVAIDLTQIRPAPVPPRRPTPAASRTGSPAKSRSQGRRSPAPSRRRPYTSGSPGADDAPSATPVKSLEPGLTALHAEGDADTVQDAPAVRRSVTPSRRETLAGDDEGGQTAGPVGQLKRLFSPLLSRGAAEEAGGSRDALGSLMDMVQRHSPRPTRARPNRPSPGAARADAVVQQPQRQQGSRGSGVAGPRQVSPSVARRLTPLRSVEEKGPVRPLESVEEKGPVRTLHSVEEMGPGILAARAASPTAARSTVEAATDTRKPRAAPVPSRRSADKEADEELSRAVSAVETAPARASADKAESKPTLVQNMQSNMAKASDVVNSIKQFLRTPGLARPAAEPKHDAGALKTAVKEVAVKEAQVAVKAQGKYSADQLIPGADPYTYDFSEDGPTWTVLSSKPCSGGTLEIIRWEGRRMLRVWLPPGYDSVGAELVGGLPSVWMHDGQNLFDASLSLSGSTWQAAETASKLINTGKLPPFAIIGIDHPGMARPYEYTPYRPGTGPVAVSGGFRSDAATWPGGGVWYYLQALVDEVVPRLSDMYKLGMKETDRVMGGSSFGGVATLCAALRFPHVWGGSLVESPSLWIAEEEFLRDIRDHIGQLPSRMFIGMGGREFSGVRPASAADEHPEADGIVKGYATQLSDILHTKGLLEGWSLKCEVQEETTHTETAWAGRYATAMTHLGTQWWHKVLNGRHGKLFTISPYPLRPGSHAVMLVNRARSTTLAGCESIRLHYGFNMNWEIREPDLDMQPAEWRLNELDLLAQAGDDLPANFSKDWWVCDFQVPEDAYEMHFALSGSADRAGLQEPREWENNNGVNYYYRLARPRPEGEQSVNGTSSAAGSNGRSDVESALDNMQMKGIQEQIAANAQALADQNGYNRYFLVPETLVAGAPAMVYFNKRCDHNFAGVSHIKLCYGWNGWDKRYIEGGAMKQDFKNSGLLQSPHLEWWCAQINVPEDAVELNFVFTNGDWLWDSNNGNNYSAAVLPPASEVEAEAEVEARRSSSSDEDEPALPLSTCRPREVSKVEEAPHGAGTMHTVHLQKRSKDDPGYSKSTRWIDEKIIRVWTPPGWNLAHPPPGGWPVLYLSDGQNLFEDRLAHQGVAWRVGYQSSDLISNGELPPYIVVGIDSAGPMRSLNYLPYTPGSGVGGFRPDSARWPGGGVSDYMRRVTQEIMPLVEQRFGAATDPSRVAFGGGSFGGVCALYTAMHYPHLFGGILAESPSLWIAEGRFLGDMEAYRGQLSERVFLACGTREFSATRPQERHDVDALLLDYCNQAARILDEKGCRPGQGRLLYQIEEGAGHHEGAWQWRFSGAMRYLWSHLWDITPRHALNEPE